MNRPLGLTTLLAAFALCACVAAARPASGQSLGPKAAGGELKLTPEEERLVRGSKAELLATGFSEAYFDAHFEPVRVLNTPGDRRVTWRFRVGGHETLVHDSLGFYTGADGRRVNTHTVAATLGVTHDITQTIPAEEASRLMRECIGEFEGGAVVFQRFGEEGRAALVFTAVSVPPPAQPAAQPAAPPAQATGARQDKLKPGGKKKPFLLIGTVDLETGRCVKGVAQVGSPHPTP